LPTCNQWLSQLGLLSNDGPFKDDLDDPGRCLRKLKSGEEYEVRLRTCGPQESDALWHGTTSFNLPSILEEHFKSGHGLKAVGGSGSVEGVYTTDRRKTACGYPQWMWDGNNHCGTIETSDQESPHLVLLELRAEKHKGIWRKRAGMNRQWAHNPEDVEIVAIVFRGMKVATEDVTI